MTFHLIIEVPAGTTDFQLAKALQNVAKQISVDFESHDTPVEPSEGKVGGKLKGAWKVEKGA